MHAFQSESTLYSYLNVKKLLDRNRRDILSLSDSHGIRTHSHLQSTSAISNTCYLQLLLCRTFYLVPSAFSLASLINRFGISNSTNSNFHSVEQFSRSLQSFLGCFPSAISNIRMRFSNESYCSFQTFEC